MNDKEVLRFQIGGFQKCQDVNVIWQKVSPYENLIVKLSLNRDSQSKFSRKLIYKTKLRYIIFYLNDW